MFVFLMALMVNVANKEQKHTTVKMLSASAYVVPDKILQLVNRQNNTILLITQLHSVCSRTGILGTNIYRSGQSDMTLALEWAHAGLCQVVSIAFIYH